MNKELQFLIYSTPRENIKIDVVVKDETIWLTQKAMAGLFDVNQPAISKHLSNIFAEGELNEKSVHSILEYTAGDGKQYQTKFYNLDAIISVGYRVNSAKATLVKSEFNRECTRIDTNKNTKGKRRKEKCPKQTALRLFIRVIRYNLRTFADFSLSLFQFSFNPSCPKATQLRIWAVKDE